MNDLSGLRVLAFESRRATEIGELIRRFGGEPVSAPALREVPLEANHAVFDYLEQLGAGAVDIVVALTGVGLRSLLEVASPRYAREQIAEWLRGVTVVARGPKPVAVLRELGVVPQLVAPEPNTWRELLGAIEASLPVAGKRVALQEYGVTNADLVVGLEALGAEVLRVPIYRWALPEDTGPLREAVRALAAAEVEIALFTSATQVHHLFELAAEQASAVRRGCERVVVASIGPICSEALMAHGLAVDLETEHGKMGQLVGDVARRGRQLLATKRAR